MVDKHMHICNEYRLHFKSSQAPGILKLILVPAILHSRFCDGFMFGKAEYAHRALIAEHARRQLSMQPMPTSNAFSLLYQY
jgi:hypothetical protein